ncbi:MAG TPA: lipoyl(octanoyl) transferase LipB [Acidobacteriota bacterium]|nr:lipoyl(octanoyl) transferase LipB [Acidobacteriota bacterium]
MEVERLSVPIIPYCDCWELQQRRVLQCQRGGPGAVIFVEHPPVITLGRAGKRSSLVCRDSDLRTAGIDLVHSNRGGDITFHGPGQLVVYPILNLRLIKKGVHDYFRSLEEATLQTLCDFGITGHRSRLGTGVWANHSQKGLSKIASMGIHISRWVTSHGVALNVCKSLEGFRYIIPCGLGGVQMTSMAELSARPVSRYEVEEAFWHHLLHQLELTEQLPGCSRYHEREPELFTNLHRRDRREHW